MAAAREEILGRLRKEIWALQGFKPVNKGTNIEVGLKAIADVFPNNSFPVAAIHEFMSTNAAGIAATSGFVTALTSHVMKKGGAAIWINSTGTVFPAALQYFGIQPDCVLFITISNYKDLLWTTEEALKCEGVTAVIAEISELSFNVSRRLQLAIERSHVSGFILRNNPKNIQPTTCAARWCITSLPSAMDDELPGVGFPRWNVEIQKVKNGKPGVWQIEWQGDQFNVISESISKDFYQEQKKAG